MSNKTTTFNLEFVFISKNDIIDENLYNITHNRRVFTPYFVLNAEHSIAAFCGEANKMQLVGIHALLNDKSLANDKTTDYPYYKLIDYELNLLANRIVEIINEKSAKYSCCSIIEGEETINEKTASIPDVKNSLLADRMLLREGGKCYKVEVDYDYNQDLTTVLIKNDVYESNRLKETFVRAKRIEVIRILKEIAEEKGIVLTEKYDDVSHNPNKTTKKVIGYNIGGDFKSTIINELKRRMKTNQKTNDEIIKGESQNCTTETTGCGCTNINTEQQPNSMTRKNKDILGRQPMNKPTKTLADRKCK